MCNTNYNFGVPKATLRLINLLEGLIKLSKAVILMVEFYCCGRVEVKISHGKRHREQSPETPRHELPVVLSWWSYVDSAFTPSNDM